MSKHQDLSDLCGQSWKETYILKKDLSTSSHLKKVQENETMRLLPRTDFSLYGEFPKIDKKILLECDKCGVVLLPCSYEHHSHHADHSKKHMPIVSVAISKNSPTNKNKSSNYVSAGSSVVKKKYPQSKNKKKKSSFSPPVPPPPLFTADVVTPPPLPSPIVASATVSVVIPPPPVQPCIKTSLPQTESVLSSITSNKHKKNKKKKKSGRRSKEITAEKVDKTEKPAPEHAKAPTLTKEMIPVKEQPPVEIKIKSASTTTKPAASSLLVIKNSEKSIPVVEPSKDADVVCRLEALLNISAASSSPVKESNNVAWNTEVEEEDSGTGTGLSPLATSDSSSFVIPEVQPEEKVPNITFDVPVKPEPNPWHVTINNNITGVLQGVLLKKPTSNNDNLSAPSVKVHTFTLSDICKENSSTVSIPISAITSPIIPEIAMASKNKYDPQPKRILIKKEQLEPLQITVAPAADKNKTQGNVERRPSIVYMPMSPITVINTTNNNMQFIKLPLTITPARPMTKAKLIKPIVVTIPFQNNTKTYTSHPKPLAVMTRNVRKIGSTFVLQNQKLELQRKEIQTMCSEQRIPAGSINTFHHHRPSILKNSARNNVKVSVKRPANDEPLNESNKHIRLNDVNGFILHADVSETAEAPVHNNSVHKKVTFQNTK